MHKEQWANAALPPTSIPAKVTETDAVFCMVEGNDVGWSFHII